jgi:ABC-type transport system substrate-binding protein
VLDERDLADVDIAAPQDLLLHAETSPVDRSTTTAPPRRVRLIGKLLAHRYQILDELGSGGMGVVYRALDTSLDREVAVKMIRSNQVPAELEERFRREAQVVARMDCPGILPIYDFGRHDDALFYVMPVVAGRDLRAYITERALTLADTVEVAAQVADALEYSHHMGVVHRDIKPENIMVSRAAGGGLRARVMDFGLAFETTEQRLTQTGAFIGSVAYMSPEQLRGCEVDGRSDVYSLGVVLYECLSGTAPFSGTVHALILHIMQDAPEPLRHRGASIDQALDDLVMACLAKLPAQRPQRCADLATALRAYLVGQGEEARRQLVATWSGAAGRSLSRSEPSFVGRAAEFGTLRQRLAAGLAGECQLVLLRGPLGCGKTRLLSEVESLARSRAVRVLRGGYSDTENVLPYQGFCELVEDHFRPRSERGSSPGSLDYSSVAGELLALFPALSEVRELREAAAASQVALPTFSAARSGDRTGVFDLLARTLRLLAANRPLVLLLENLQDAEVSVEALQYVFHRLGMMPLLIVATVRDTMVDRRHPVTKLTRSLENNPRFCLVPLGPLGPEEHEELVRSQLAGTGALSPEAYRKLYEASEGNPFFTLEMVRAAQQGSSAAGLPVEAALFGESLPETVQQAVHRRVEKLPDDLRTLIATASVLGRSFAMEDLEALLPDRSDHGEAVDHLVEIGLLAEDRHARGDHLRFTSGVVQEALYAELPRRRRRTLHRACAELLEARHAGRLERIRGQLLHHLTRGGVVDKALDCAVKLARHSLDAFSPEDAIRAVRQGLDLLDEVEDGEVLSLEGQLRALLATALKATGDLAGAVREAQGAVVAYDRAGDRAAAAEVCLVVATAAWQIHRIDLTWQFVERGLELARASTGKETLRRLLALGATAASLRGDRKASRAFEEEARVSFSKARSPESGGIHGGGTMVTSLPSSPPSLDPAVTGLLVEAEVVTNLFQCLVQTDARGHLLPVLCERWDGAPDARSFIFGLRHDVRFSDGTPLTADEVKHCFENSARRAGETRLSPFHRALTGMTEFLDGQASAVSGIEVLASDRLRFNLDEALPLFPALCADPRASLVREANGLVGTGPFVLAAQEEDRIVLARNANCWRDAPKIDRLVFLTTLDAAGRAAALRAGEVDLGRDLHPDDLDAILGQPGFRAGFREVTRNVVFFALFHRSGPATARREVRRGLAGIVRVQDIVYQTLGRLGYPAVSLLPPGILGHDAGRRRELIPLAEARRLLASAGLEPPIVLRAAVHPVMQDRYKSITRAIFDEWAALGIEIQIKGGSPAEYRQLWGAEDGVDVLLGFWAADYDDPDNFTHTLFHSKTGLFRSYFSSARSDGFLERARGEANATSRQVLYQQFEDLLEEDSALLPLFYEVEYLIASPEVRGLRLTSSPPYVNYPELTKVEHSRPVIATQTGSGALRVAFADTVGDLDPSTAVSSAAAEVTSLIFERLTAIDEHGVVVPWLAAEWRPLAGGRQYYFRLREGVSFHGGRRLTSRDVRSSFERGLLAQRSAPVSPFLAIAGAGRIIAGRATGLSGFHIETPDEFVLELEQPLSFFPAMLSSPMAAILPEGTTSLGASWKEGCSGTGPFRLVRWAPGRIAELEANPRYWREGYPRSRSLVVDLGVAPEEACRAFKEGRISLTPDLRPEEIRALRRDPTLAGGYHEWSALGTFFLALNGRSGVLADPKERQALLADLDVPRLVQTAFRAAVTPAQTLIPPLLIGSVAERPAATSHSGTRAGSRSGVLRVALSPSRQGRFVSVWSTISDACRSLGYQVDQLSRSMHEWAAPLTSDAADLYLGGWSADYPDPDSFADGLLSRERGYLGQFLGSEEIDRLILKGRAETDSSLRRAIYLEIEDLLRRDQLVLPLFYQQSAWFVRPEVSGLRMTYSHPSVRYDELCVH